MKMLFMWQLDKSVIYFLFSHLCDFCIPFPSYRAVSHLVGGGGKEMEFYFLSLSLYSFLLFSIGGALFRSV